MQWRCFMCAGGADADLRVWSWRRGGGGCRGCGDASAFLLGRLPSWVGLRREGGAEEVAGSDEAWGGIIGGYTHWWEEGEDPPSRARHGG